MIEKLKANAEMINFIISFSLNLLENFEVHKKPNKRFITVNINTIK